MKKPLVVGVIVLFLLMTTFSSGFNLEKQSTIATLDGNTLYVGGNGSGNYTKIQDAINDSSDGDTVYVYDDSSPYLENLDINKSIKLIGENKETTIIKSNDSVNVSADWVNVTDFTIQGYIVIDSVDNIIISDNIVDNNSWTAIALIYSCNNIISNNIILNSIHCIELSHSSNNIITGNKMSNGSITMRGISIFSRSNNNSIICNEISNCIFGVMLSLSRNNIIEKNNFIGNKINAIFIYFWRDIWNGNYWDSNYWDKHTGNRPKIIFGTIGLFGYIPWVNFDWHPASEPYDIGV